MGKKANTVDVSSVSFQHFAISSKGLEGRQETDRQKRETRQVSDAVPKAGVVLQASA